MTDSTCRYFIGGIFGIIIATICISVSLFYDKEVTQEMPCNLERDTMHEVCSASSDSASCRITQIKYVECMGVVDVKETN